jgi:O-succinylbenzoate synthase
MHLVSLEWKPYRRRFHRPLATAAGVFTERRGILLRLADTAGRHAYGEAAPWPGHGSEASADDLLWLTAARADAALRSVGPPADRLPALAFAWGCALEDLTAAPASWRYANTWLGGAIGAAATEAAHAAAAAGYQRLKFKIGVAARAEEIHACSRILDGLPAACKLRLDANGSLTPADFSAWAAALAGHSGIEFIEQPFAAAPAGLAMTLAACEHHPSPAIALDESIATRQRWDAAHAAGWRGLGVLKPALFGSPTDLQERLAAAPQRWIASSAFETGIGLHALLRVAWRCGLRAPVGCGTIGWCADDLDIFSPGPALASDPITRAACDYVWENVIRDD